MVKLTAAEREFVEVLVRIIRADNDDDLAAAVERSEELAADMDADVVAACCARAAREADVDEDEM
jgi:hypothetical protein